ncbi:MAG: efflux RND transporter permease subunit [Pseudomonadota bacterium]
MNIATLFFNNKHLLIFTIVALLFTGILSIYSLPRLEDPRITNRDPIIITAFPGATAQRVETLVTEPIEQALQEIDSVKTIESVSSSGISTISIELQPEVTNAQNKEVFSEIRDKVTEASTSFPKGVLTSTIDDKRDPAAYTHITAISWEHTSPINLTLLNRFAEELASRIRATEGTTLVRLYGEISEEILATVEPNKLSEIGLTISDVTHALKNADIKSPAGSLRGNTNDINIELSGQFEQLERIRQTPLLEVNGKGIVQLGDLAHLERKFVDPVSEIATVNGKRVIFVASRMGSDHRIDQWSQQVNQIINDYQRELGDNIELKVLFEQGKYTVAQLSNLVSNLIAGAIVVIAVVLIMMGWRLALIVGCALPLVSCIVLFSMHVNGGAIHQMSIYGMIIALGLLIDNAIVMADEVTKNKSSGLSSSISVKKAVTHLFWPLLASTLTTILAFMPIVLLEGSVGDFVSSIGSTVIVSLIASFVIAMTIISALAGLFAKPTNNTSDVWWQTGIRSTWLSKKIKRLYENLLNSPIKAILIAIFLPISGFIVATQLGNQFFPPVDRDMIEIKLWLPNNTNINHTYQKTRELDVLIKQQQDVELVSWLIGGSFPTVYYNAVMHKDASSYYAHAIVKYTHSLTAKNSIKSLQHLLNDSFPESQVLVRQFAQGPPIFEDIEYRIFGPSVEKLKEIGQEFQLALQNHPQVILTQASIPREEPKLLFEANEDEAQLAGLSLLDISMQMQANLEGLIGGMVLEDLEQLPVRVRLSNTERYNFDYIQDMQLVSRNSDEWVPLSTLGEFILIPELSSITHYNALRVNRVRAFVENGALPIDIAKSVLHEMTLNGFEIPSGYRVEFGGALEQDKIAVGNILEHMPILLFFIVGTLIILFSSLSVSLLLGLVAVFSLGLGFLSTWAMGFPISFNTILGTLGLLGLAFNNSIIVLAAIYANPLAKSGEINALVEATISTSRHILSTTLTTIGGFLPILLFVGGDFWPSLSIVLAGGVAGSMILALLFVPAAYLMLFNTQAISTDQPKLSNTY